MRKLALILALWLILAPQAAFADGFIMEPISPTRYDYVNENGQTAYIDYRDGQERLILAIKSDSVKKGAVWIVPIPGDPNKVELEITSRLPEFSGTELKSLLATQRDEIKDWVELTQLVNWTNIMERQTLGVTSMDSKNFNTFSASSGSTEGPVADVNVYQHIEKAGMTSEVITAKTADGLDSYLTAKGLDIDVETLLGLTSYIGQDYSLIVSWLSAGVATQRGLMIDFPTKRLFYPLKPTSVYGEVVVPTEIRVVGHVTPEIGSSIKAMTEVEYFTKASFSSSDLLLRETFTQQDYTLIKIKASSQNLTEDLYISQRTPLTVGLMKLGATNPGGLAIILILLFSWLSGAVVGQMLLADYWSWAKTATANLGSLILLLVFSSIKFGHRRQIAEADRELADRLPEYFLRVHAWTVFLGLVLIYLAKYVLIDQMVPGWLGYVIMLMPLVIMLFLYFVNRRNYPVARALLKRGYSYLDLATNNNIVYTFAICFSLVFILISGIFFTTVMPEATFSGYSYNIHDYIIR